MERMLINATEAEELRVAIVKGQYLYDLDIEHPDQQKKKANIYKGRVTRVEPSLEAVFVEYGAKRQGFLPLKEISPEYYAKPFNPNQETDKPSVKALIKEGQELMVQVDKEERGTKGAALTTYITLAGCYLVLMPNNPRSGGISRRIEGDEREELKNILKNLHIADGMGVIVRTAGLGKQQDDLQWDVDVLVNQWHAIKNAYDQKSAPFLIHQEGDVIIRSIRDNLRRSIGEIIIDDSEAFVKAKNYIEQVKPDFVNQVKLYQDTVPLFNRYQIESQIETAYQRVVPLPSGGSLVIDRTEALVSVDINSAKSTGGTDIEETAVNTNLEAADEVARQLRLRDLGGLVVIDFIDMTPVRHQRQVETRMREALATDRARVQIGRISRFGLLEMSRQRLRLSLGESAQEVCPRCDGRGTMRSVQSLALSIVRLIEEEALKDNTKQINVQLPVNMATFVMNEKRQTIVDIEKRHQVSILIVGNAFLEAPNYKIERIKTDGTSAPMGVASFELVEAPEVEIPEANVACGPRGEKPAIKHVAPPTRRPKKRTGILATIWNALFGSSEAKKSEQKSKSAHRPHHNKRRGGQQRDNRNQQHRRSSGGGRHHQNRGGQSGGQRHQQQGQGGDNQQRSQRSGGGKRPQRSGGGNQQSTKKAGPANTNQQGQPKSDAAPKAVTTSQQDQPKSGTAPKTVTTEEN